MTERRVVDSRDAEAWRALFADQPRKGREGAEAWLRTFDRLNRLLREAEGPGRPAELAQRVEAAKTALDEVERCALSAGIEPQGFDRARAQLKGLEMTYRAFGYYRQAGIP